MNKLEKTCAIISMACSICTLYLIPNTVTCAMSRHFAVQAGTISLAKERDKDIADENMVDRFVSGFCAAGRNFGYSLAHKIDGIPYK